MNGWEKVGTSEGIFDECGCHAVTTRPDEAGETSISARILCFLLCNIPADYLYWLESLPASRSFFISLCPQQGFPLEFLVLVTSSGARIVPSFFTRSIVINFLLSLAVTTRYSRHYLLCFILLPGFFVSALGNLYRSDIGCHSHCLQALSSCPLRNIYNFHFCPPALTVLLLLCRKKISFIFFRVSTIARRSLITTTTTPRKFQLHEPFSDFTEKF